MILTDEQTDYISHNLAFYGVADAELKEGLLDHICTYIENSTYTDFDSAYAEAINKFGGHYAMGILQQQTYMAVTFGKTRKRQNIVYNSALVTSLLLGSGSVFKIMYWPYATILILMGFIVLNFVFLPVFFYHRYKLSGTGQS